MSKNSQKVAEIDVFITILRDFSLKIEEFSEAEYVVFGSAKKCGAAQDQLGEIINELLSLQEEFEIADSEMEE